MAEKAIFDGRVEPNDKIKELGKKLVSMIGLQEKAIELAQTSMSEAA